MKRSCQCGQLHNRGERCPIGVAKNNARPKSYSAEYKRNERLMRQAFRNGDPCVICSKPIMMVNELSIEHVIPRRHGGSDKRDNLGYAHRRCNYAWNKQR